MEQKDMVSATETAEQNAEIKDNTSTTSVNEQESPQKEVKTFTRDEVNKMINAEKTKIRETVLEEEKAKRTEAEKLASMKAEEKLQYQLKKEQEEKEILLKRLNANQLKDEALKTATAEDTAFDIGFLELIDFENETAESLNEKTKMIKNVQDKMIAKAVNEYSKESAPQTSESKPLSTSGFEKFVQENKL